MWREICEDNQQALLGALERFEKELTDIRRSLEEADSEGLERAFSEAKNGRDEWARKKGWA